MADQELEKVLGDLRKRFGSEIVMMLGDNTGAKVDRISSGSLTLDLALGGGFPKGRVIEVYGPESSGKSTLCLHLIAEAQKLGGRAAFIDVEHALDPEYATKVGVNVEELVFSQPDSGEKALEVVEALVRSGKFAVIVVDSVAALVPLKELEGDMGDAQMGMQARMMSQALRKLTGAISNTNTIVVFTNQLRQKIGVMFGNPETTTGGQALKFYASVRLDIRRIQSIKVGEDVTGSRTRVKVVKNKVYPPFKQAEFDIVFNEGISKVSEVLDLGVKFGIIDKRGSFFYYNGERLAQGKDSTLSYLRNNPSFMADVEAKIRLAVAGGAVVEAEDENAELLEELI